MGWHSRAQALTCERRTCSSPGRLLAVDEHGRTLPRLRAALGLLLAVFGIDAVSA